METLIVKVNNKKNLIFLRKLLLKFNFVVKVETTPSTESIHLTDRINVAGRLNHYADATKIKDEKTVWQQVVKEKHGSH